jgi:hypothetical protein
MTPARKLATNAIKLKSMALRHGGRIPRLTSTSASDPASAPRDRSQWTFRTRPAGYVDRQHHPELYVEVRENAHRDCGSNGVSGPDRAELSGLAGEVP